MMPRRWRWRGRKKKGPGRPPSKLVLHSKPKLEKMEPEPCLNSKPVVLTFPEYNVLQLIDLNELTQQETAERMNTSQGTIWRLIKSARKKLMKALTQARPLHIVSKGNIEEA